MYKLIWRTVNTNEVLNQIKHYFNISDDILNDHYESYLRLHKKYNHKTLGEQKTLNTLETFIVYLMIKLYEPKNIVEIGTFLGKSTRRIIDIINELKLDTKIICYDIVDKVQFFNKNEVNLNLKDITNSINEDVIDKYDNGLIYLDAHPYNITLNTINAVLNSKNWRLIIHDCGEALCNPNMTISKNDNNITSLTGHWERYVLAEVLNINNPLSADINDCMFNGNHIKVFDTLHGLCVINK